MKSNGKQTLWIALAVAVVVVGIVVAVTTSGGSTHKHTHGGHAQAGARVAGSGSVAVASSYLGISRSELRKALAAHRTLAQIANATNGRTANGLVDALVGARVRRLEARASREHLTRAQVAIKRDALRVATTARVSGTSISAGGAETMLTASHYLGIPVSVLIADQRSGRSLAQIAAASHGRSSAGLIAVLVGARSGVITNALDAHRITAAQANLRLRALKARMALAVERAARPQG